MATIWKSTKHVETSNTFSGTILSSWSRQQKLAMIAGFAILGLLLAVSACSKQSSKSAGVGLLSPAAASASSSTTPPPGNGPAQGASSGQAPAAPVTAAKAKKTSKKRPANVTYSDPNSGVSFDYPRKFRLASGDQGQPESARMGSVPMNFVQPGGVPVATVALPGTLYPGTDFATGFFRVNVNRSLAEHECSHFAFVDTSDADGEPIDAQKLKVGSAAMEMTSEFSGNATQQMETQYYHNYEKGVCYEYVLGLGTAGFGAQDGIEPVNRDEVFNRLQKILATVKILPVAPEQVANQVTEHVAEQAAVATDSAK